jgi:transposase
MSQAPLTLPRFKYGNSLITNAVIAHYVEGIPVHQIARTLGVGVSTGGLLRQFHYLAQKWEPVMAQLIKTYQESDVRHADETGWRTDGKNGYAWLFCTETLSIFQFGKTRASSVPLSILGEKQLSGVLVVDRYGGYNKMPCPLQYCYAHLLRDLQSLEKKFPKSKEIKIFIAHLAPLFAEAMGLRRTLPDDVAYTKRAKEIQEEMISLCKKQAKAIAIQTFQRIILDNEHRLFHWVSNRNIPPDNNRAERELRPTVIARKNSFGSQSQKGADTRSVLMSVLHTAAKRIDDATTMRRWFLSALDALARDPATDLSEFLTKT